MKYYVTKEYMDILKKIAEETAINGKYQPGRRPPPVPEGCFYFKISSSREETKRVTKLIKRHAESGKAIYEAQL